MYNSILFQFQNKDVLLMFKYLTTLQQKLDAVFST